MYPAHIVVARGTFPARLKTPNTRQKGVAYGPNGRADKYKNNVGRSRHSITWISREEKNDVVFVLCITNYFFRANS